MTITAPRRLGAALTAIALLLSCMSGMALAQSQTEVTVASTSGQRMMEVRDLAGADLDRLALTTGVPQAFRVQVEDETLPLLDQRSFRVDATMTNLYRETGPGTYDYAGPHIPAERVEVSYLPDPLGLSGLLADVRPTHVLRSVDGGIACSDIAAAAGLTLLSFLLDPLNQTLCRAAGGVLSVTGLLTSETPVVFSGVEAVAGVVDGVDLGGLGAGALPLVPQVPIDQAGGFTVADYANGIGAGATKPVGVGDATEKRLLIGTRATDPLTAVLGAVDGALGSVPLASGTGAGVRMSTGHVLTALQGAGAPAEVRALGKAISEAGLSAAQRTAIVNSLLRTELVPPTADDILSLSGRYASFPRLQADGSGVPAGRYAGTLTITLVE
jgi:hypothetical protein